MAKQSKNSSERECDISKDNKAKKRVRANVKKEYHMPSSSSSSSSSNSSSHSSSSSSSSAEDEDNKPDTPQADVLPSKCFTRPDQTRADASSIEYSVPRPDKTRADVKDSGKDAAPYLSVGILL